MTYPTAEELRYRKPLFDMLAELSDEELDTAAEAARDGILRCRAREQLTLENWYIAQRTACLRELTFRASHRLQVERSSRALEVARG